MHIALLYTLNKFGERSAVLRLMLRFRPSMTMKVAPLMTSLED